MKRMQQKHFMWISNFHSGLTHLWLAGFSKESFMFVCFLKFLSCFNNKSRPEELLWLNRVWKPVLVAPLTSERLVCPGAGTWRWWPRTLEEATASALQGHQEGTAPCRDIWASLIRGVCVYLKAMKSGGILFILSSHPLGQYVHDCPSKSGHTHRSQQQGTHSCCLKTTLNGFSCGLFKDLRILMQRRIKKCICLTLQPQYIWNKGKFCLSQMWTSWGQRGWGEWVTQEELWGELLLLWIHRNQPRWLRPPGHLPGEVFQNMTQL